MKLTDMIKTLCFSPRWLGLFLLSLFICLCDVSAQAVAYDKLFTRHSKAAKVPKPMVLAIARQESGLNPLCINIEGQDYTPANRAEAEAIIRKAEAEKRSYDVGLMQINSQWIRKWKMDPVDLLDPDTNIRLGIKILRQEIDRHGLNWKAVGAYHSPTPERAMQYASRVYARMNGQAPEGLGANQQPGILSPRLQVLVDKGIITRAEARSIASNPRLRMGLKRLPFSKEGRKAVMERYQRLRDKSKSRLAQSAE